MVRDRLRFEPLGYSSGSHEGKERTCRSFIEKTLDILEVMQPLSANRQYIFPSRNNPKEPTNSQTANAALKRIGYGGKLVAHGLRFIASTALNEVSFNPDVIESALAYSDKTK